MTDKTTISIQVVAPVRAVRTMALAKCAFAAGPEPCTEPCDGCFQAAEREIAELNEQLALRCRDLDPDRVRRLIDKWDVS
jgi:hypothetical protein